MEVLPFLFCATYFRIGETLASDAKSGPISRNDFCSVDNKLCELDPAKIQSLLKLRLAKIKESCGEVCEVSPDKLQKVDGILRKSVDCRKMFTEPEFDAPALHRFPPKKVTMKYKSRCFSRVLRAHFHIATKMTSSKLNRIFRGHARKFR